ncbi:hypothetical protein JSY14_09150 [Brachybacterium sp. EF45031]|nr:hypothetical protein [Brachybacterium sillae]MCS6712181.1 hypothetical protein [Brachybacterium sillae]
MEIEALTHHRGWQNTSLYIGWLETTEKELERACARASRSRAGSVEETR